jgi:hypothetical protein
MMLGGAVFSWCMPCADPLEVFPFMGAMIPLLSVLFVPGVINFLAFRMEEKVP